MRRVLRTSVQAGVPARRSATRLPEDASRTRISRPSKLGQRSPPFGSISIPTRSSCSSRQGLHLGRPRRQVELPGGSRCNLHCDMDEGCDGRRHRSWRCRRRARRARRLADNAEEATSPGQLARGGDGHPGRDGRLMRCYSPSRAAASPARRAARLPRRRVARLVVALRKLLRNSPPLPTRWPMQLLRPWARMSPQSGPAIRELSKP